MSEELVALGQEWAAAEERHDTAALADLLTDDFVGVGPRGFKLNKEQWLARYTSGNLVNQSFTWSDVGIREYGMTAVAIGVQSQRTSYQGHPTDGRFRATQVLVKEGPRWRLASIHLSNLADGA
ncbi:MAG TPA: nuclear transport factor 2 family protein [Mycobacteriales bacterium]|nr:nuclear transport factor 2 family protein [Mycobacteriales bacterium]